VAASSRVDITISKETLEQISGLSIALAAGFDEKRIDKALAAASLYAAKAMVKPVRNAAPVKTGRIRRAIWANPVMKGKPGAYVGIRPGKSRADTKGAYYRWIVTSGTRGFRKTKKGLVPTIRVPGRPFVADTVNNNFDTVLRLFGDALASILERGIPKRGGVRVRLPKPR
jgi:hypothetical protein